MKYLLFIFFETILLTIVATLFLFMILGSVIEYPEYSNNVSGYFHWLSDLFGENLLTHTSVTSFSDEFGMDADDFVFEETLITIFSMSPNSLGYDFLHTVGLSFICLIAAILLSLTLNILIVFFSGIFSQIARWLEMFLALISGIHIIVLAIFFYTLLQNLSPLLTNTLIALLIICGSNVFYNVSSQQFLTLETLKDADYILASKAWGDSSIRQMRRSIIMMVIGQGATMLAPIMTNTIIIEIIFQGNGLGSHLFKEVFNRKHPDLGIILGITLMIILLIQVFNAFRQIVEKLLLEYR